MIDYINITNNKKEVVREISFNKGFNIVLADKATSGEGEDSRKTRNGVGKSSLIDVIHFLFGSRPKQGEFPRIPYLHGWFFEAGLVLGGQRVTISREVISEKGLKQKSTIYVTGGSAELPDGFNGNRIALKEWIKLLGKTLFGLEEGLEAINYSPSFRSLFSYIVRRNQSHGGFFSPFRNFRNQLEWDKQVNSLFLLDLNWEIAAKSQILRDRQKVIRQMLQEAKMGMSPIRLGTKSSLRSEIAVLKSKITGLSEELKSFKVHPEYRRIEEDANELTRQIHELSNANVATRQLLNSYRSATIEEIPPDAEAVKELYEEAGVVFGDGLIRRLEEVENFHKVIIKNRRNFVKSEIANLERLISEREGSIENLTAVRVRKMEILKTHGALDEYSKLQNELALLRKDFEDKQTRLSYLEKFEKAKSELKLDFENLYQSAIISSLERSEQLDKVMARFSEITENLYEKSGNLIIEPNPKGGFSLDYDIEGKGSSGISNCVIFAYDVTLAGIWANERPSPKLLIHDSNIFYGVDERQVGHALGLAVEESRRLDFQYICFLNSDKMNKLPFTRPSVIEDSIILTLKDETPGDKLLRFQF